MAKKELDVRTVNSAEELMELVNTLTNEKETDGGNMTDEEAMQTSLDAAQEAIDIARFRQEMGSEDYLVVYPEWLTGESRWGETPTAVYAFGKVEFDGEDKRAVLFSSVREIDDNIIQNNAWSRSDIGISEAIKLIDQTENVDYPMENVGEIWIPRSYMRCVEVGEENE